MSDSELSPERISPTIETRDDMIVTQQVLKSRRKHKLSSFHVNEDSLHQSHDQTLTRNHSNFKTIGDTPLGDRRVGKVKPTLDFETGKHVRIAEEPNSGTLPQIPTAEAIVPSSTSDGAEGERRGVVGHSQIVVLPQQLDTKHGLKLPFGTAVMTPEKALLFTQAMAQNQSQLSTKSRKKANSDLISITETAKPKNILHTSIRVGSKKQSPSTSLNDAAMLKQRESIVNTLRLRQQNMISKLRSNFNGRMLETQKIGDQFGSPLGQGATNAMTFGAALQASELSYKFQKSEQTKSMSPQGHVTLKPVYKNLNLNFAPQKLSTQTSKGPEEFEDGQRPVGRHRRKKSERYRPPKIKREKKKPPEQDFQCQLKVVTKETAPSEAVNISLANMKDLQKHSKSSFKLISELLQDKAQRQSKDRLVPWPGCSPIIHKQVMLKGKKVQQGGSPSLVGTFSSEKEEHRIQFLNKIESIQNLQTIEDVSPALRQRDSNFEETANVSVDSNPHRRHRRRDDGDPGDNRISPTLKDTSMTSETHSQHIGGDGALKAKLIDEQNRTFGDKWRKQINMDLHQKLATGDNPKNKSLYHFASRNDGQPKKESQLITSYNELEHRTAGIIEKAPLIEDSIPHTSEMAVLNKSKQPILSKNVSLRESFQSIKPGEERGLRGNGAQENNININATNLAPSGPGSPTSPYNHLKLVMPNQANSPGVKQADFSDIEEIIEERNRRSKVGSPLKPKLPVSEINRKFPHIKTSLEDSFPQIIEREHTTDSVESIEEPVPNQKQISPQASLSKIRSKKDIIASHRSLATSDLFVEDEEEEGLPLICKRNHTITIEQKLVRIHAQQRQAAREHLRIDPKKLPNRHRFSRLLLKSIQKHELPSREEKLEKLRELKRKKAENASTLQPSLPKVQLQQSPKRKEVYMNIQHLKDMSRSTTNSKDKFEDIGETLNNDSLFKNNLLQKKMSGQELSKIGITNALNSNEQTIKDDEPNSKPSPPYSLMKKQSEMSHLKDTTNLREDESQRMVYLLTAGQNQFSPSRQQQIQFVNSNELTLRQSQNLTEEKFYQGEVDQMTLPLSYQNQTIFGNNKFPKLRNDEKETLGGHETQYRQRPPGEGSKQTSFISPYYQSFKGTKKMNSTLIDNSTKFRKRLVSNKKREEGGGQTAQDFERKFSIEKKSSVNTGQILENARNKMNKEHMAIESGGQEIKIDNLPTGKHSSENLEGSKKAGKKSGLKTSNPVAATYLSPILASPTNSATKDHSPGHRSNEEEKKEEVKAPVELKQPETSLIIQPQPADLKSPNDTMMINGYSSILKQREQGGASPISLPGKSNQSRYLKKKRGFGLNERKKPSPAAKQNILKSIKIVHHSGKKEQEQEQASAEGSPGQQSLQEVLIAKLMQMKEANQNVAWVHQQLAKYSKLSNQIGFRKNEMLPLIHKQSLQTVEPEGIGIVGHGVQYSPSPQSPKRSPSQDRLKPQAAFKKKAKPSKEFGIKGEQLNIDIQPVHPHQRMIKSPSNISLSKVQKSMPTPVDQSPEVKGPSNPIISSKKKTVLSKDPSKVLSPLSDRRQVEAAERQQARMLKHDDRSEPGSSGLNSGLNSGEQSVIGLSTQVEDRKDEAKPELQQNLAFALIPNQIANLPQNLELVELMMLPAEITSPQMPEPRRLRKNSPNSESKTTLDMLKQLSLQVRTRK